MKPNFDGIPQELKELNQWCLWKKEKRNNEDKTTKVPYQINGKKALSNTPTTWSSYQNVCNAFNNDELYDGIGFFFSKNDPYCFVDLDSCVTDGEIAQWALDVIKIFNSYTEFSQSYNGIHIIVKGNLNGNKGNHNRKLHFEVYDNVKYLALTGFQVNGFPHEIKTRQPELIKIHSQFFPTETPKAKNQTENNPISKSDEDVVKIIQNSKNAPKFNKLMDGIWEGDYPSQSEAESALAWTIAFVTHDPTQIESILKSSKFYREKWDKHKSYLSRTIQHAIDNVPLGNSFSGNNGKSKKTEHEQEETTTDEPNTDNSQQSEKSSEKTRQTKKKKGDSQATILIALCKDNGIELWHTKEKQAMATFRTNNHSENWLTESKTFKSYLQHIYYQHYKTAPGKQSVSDAINVLDGMALFDGKEQESFIRMAYVDDKAYLDLTNDTWQVVEIDSDGWKIVDNSPIPFRRGRGMLPLPAPTQESNVWGLFDIFHVDIKIQLLLLSWLMGTMNQKGPFPILAVNGEQGSGKSFLCKVVKQLLDPGIAMLKSLPRDERDMIISANNSWILSYDNISGLSEWISDAMCRLSTGGGFSIRELYSDSEEMIFDVKRPIILNGIESMGLRGDFADRTILINLPTINSKARIDEKTLDAQFKESHPAILGGLCDTVSTALRNINNVNLDELPRMADFAIWITAGEQELGVKNLAGLYQENRDQQCEIVLGASTVGTAMLDFMANRDMWEGTLKQLLEELDCIVDITKRKEKSYPKDPIRLSSKLRRDAPQLRNSGINIAFEGHTKKGSLVRIEKKL